MARGGQPLSSSPEGGPRGALRGAEVPVSPSFKPFLVTWDAAIKFPGQPMGSCPQDILLSLRRAGVVTLQQGECRPLWVPTRLCKSPSHTLK